MELLKPGELDSLLRYPSGRSARMARKGLIPHIELPDREIRFDPEEIEAWLRQRANGVAAQAADETALDEKVPPPGHQPDGGEFRDPDTGTY